MGKRLSGLNPLAYQGVEPLSPPQSLLVNRAPTINDRNYVIGTFWNVKNTQQTYILINLDGGRATWVPLGGGGFGANDFVTNSGTATQVGGVLNIFGGISALTSGSANTITITDTNTLADDFIANFGHAVPVSGVLNILGGNQFTTAAAGNVVAVSLDNGANGQILVAGGTNPTWENITSTGGTVTITNGPNSINLETSGSTGSQVYHTDSGDAIPAMGILNVIGGSNINTTGATNVLHTILNNNVTISGSWTTGTTVTAGTGLTVTSGGINSTGTTTLNSLGAGVMQTTGAGVVFSDNGGDGAILIGGGSAPQWNTITSTGGSVTITNSSNHIDLEAAGSFAPGAFLAVQTSIYNSTFITEYFLGSSVALTPIFDDGGNFYVGSGSGSAATFTAPSTGIYHLGLMINMPFATAISGSPAAAHYILRIRTTNRTFSYNGTAVPVSTSGVPESQFFNISCDMSVGHTAQFSVQMSYDSGSLNYNLAQGSSTATLGTYIYGFRVH